MTLFHANTGRFSSSRGHINPSKTGTYTHRGRKEKVTLARKGGEGLAVLLGKTRGNPGIQRLREHAKGKEEG